MVKLCMGVMEIDYDPDVQAFFDWFSPAHPLLESVAPALALEGGSVGEEEIVEVAVQRGGGSGAAHVEKERDWEIVKR